jgi:activating signal cointegrator complex subunit 2
MLTLSSVYDTGLTSVARADSRAQSLAQHVASPHTILDDWERLYLESKVALIDSFHVLIITMLRDMSSGAQTEHDLDRSFDTLFSLVQASSSPPPPSDRVPYLNQSLLADYQHAYGLSRMLTSSLQHIAESDARIDALDAELRSLDVVVTDQRDPAGALRPLVHLKNLRAPVAESHGSALDQSKGKGKDVQIPADDDNDNDPDLDAKVSRVLDVLPDHAPEYVRALLTHPDYPFRGDAEKVLDALLTDTAPSPQDLPGVARGGGGSGREGLVYAKDRKNVWDDEVAEISQAHVGKRRCASVTICFAISFQMTD